MRGNLEVAGTPWGEIIGPEAADELFDGSQLVVEGLEQLPELMTTLQVVRPLLVVDPDALQSAGLVSTVEYLLGHYAAKRVHYRQSALQSGQAANAASAAVRHQADVVLAIGDGACVDVAKLAALGKYTAEVIESTVKPRRPLSENPLPIVAVPTTSGSGSEATQSVTMRHHGRALSIAHPLLRPAAVVLESQFHVNMPHSVAACEALAALGHVLESLWSATADEQSQRLARLAGRLMTRWMTKSVLTADIRSRIGMMVAAHLAGRAINLSQTAAAHGVAELLGEQFNLARGHAVALVLGQVGIANLAVSQGDCQDPRGPDAVRHKVRQAASVLRCPVEEMLLKMRALLERFELPHTLQLAGVPLAALQDLAARVDPTQLAANPRRLAADQIAGILQDAWD